MDTDMDTDMNTPMDTEMETDMDMDLGPWSTVHIVKYILDGLVEEQLYRQSKQYLLTCSLGLSMYYVHTCSTLADL